MLDSYTEKRRSDTHEHTVPSWRRQPARITKFLLLKIAMTPGINQFLRLFNDNLYARERLAESKRGLEKEVADSLLTLDISIAEIEVPENTAFAGKALKDLYIRNKTGASIVRIIRGGVNINIPGGSNRIFPNDRIIIAGSDTDITAFQDLMQTSMATAEQERLRDTNTSIILDNYTITADSPICGKSILKSGIREKGGCIVIGIGTSTDSIRTNPDPATILNEGNIIVVAGEKQKIQAFFA